MRKKRTDKGLIRIISKRLLESIKLMPPLKDHKPKRRQSAEATWKLRATAKAWAHCVNSQISMTERRRTCTIVLKCHLGATGVCLHSERAVSCEKNVFSHQVLGDSGHDNCS